jgi:glycerol-3-phosphate acyltransferase PlsX
MKIVLDAMGGDRIPETPVEGAIEALEVLDGTFQIILVGDKERIERELETRRYSNPRLSVEHASQIVGMSEPPAQVLKKKKDSSISVGLKLQKEGKADAFISAGNTGAVMAQSLLTLGRIKGITRPAIMTIFPTMRDPCIVLDVGANVDSKPIHLLHFAVMGHVYAREFLDRPNPKIGLLSIGEEPAKGDELTVLTHSLLKESKLNFIGNVEGRDIIQGVTDIVVCDGFVGNVILKLSESVIYLVMSMIKSATSVSPVRRLGALLMKPTFDVLKKNLNYEEYGGAPLLGIGGVSIICHGGSSPKAIRNAIQTARFSVKRDINRHIRAQLSEFQEE